MTWISGSRGKGRELRGDGFGEQERVEYVVVDYVVHMLAGKG
jgi:hypothetical protein